MPEEVMTLVTDSEYTKWLTENSDKVFGIKRQFSAQRDADLKVLEAQKKEWISLYNEENIKVRNLEAKEKEWAKEEAEWLTRWLNGVLSSQALDLFDKDKFQAYIAELRKEGK